MKSDTEKRLEQYGVWVKVKPREVTKPKAEAASFELSDLEIPESEPTVEPVDAPEKSADSGLPSIEDEFDQQPSAPSGESVRPLTPEEEQLIGSFTPEEEESGSAITQEEEQLLDDLENELSATEAADVPQAIEASETMELEIGEDNPPILEESAQAPEVPDIALGQESGEELPELELDEGAERLPESEPVEESAGEGPFDDLKALEDELSTVKAGVAAAQTGAGPDILARIEEELKSIKTDLTDLRQTITELRQAPPKTAEPASEEENKGFFEEDEDETIALTGDELDNILNTAEITEGTAEPEALIPDEPDTLLGKPDLLDYTGEKAKEPEGESAAPHPEPEIPDLSLENPDEPGAAAGETESAPEAALDDLMAPPVEKDAPDAESGPAPLEELSLEEETPMEEISLDLDAPAEEPGSGSGEEISLDLDTPVEEETPAPLEDLTFEEETPEKEAEAIEEIAEIEEIEEIEEIGEIEEVEEVKNLAADTVEAEESPSADTPAGPLDIDLSIENLEMEEAPVEAVPDLEIPEEEAPVEELGLDELVLDEPVPEAETAGTADAPSDADIEMVPLEALPAATFMEPKEIAIDDDILQKEIREIDADTRTEGPEIEIEEEAATEKEPAIHEELPEAVVELDAEAPKEAAETEAPSIPDDLKGEVRSVLKYLDQLLEALPEDKIKEFADSEYFTMYKKLFEELGLSG